MSKTPMADPAKFLHHYVIFHKDSTLTCGWVRAFHQKKCEVLSLSGKVEALTPNRFIHYWTPTAEVSSDDNAHQNLRLQWEHSDPKHATVDLETLHSALTPTQKYTLEEILNSSDYEHLSLLRALHQNKRLFKNKHPYYIPRSDEELEHWDLQQHKQQEQERNKEAAQAWVTSVQEKSPDVSRSLSTKEQEWVNQIRSILILQRQSPFWKEWVSLLKIGHCTSQVMEQKLQAFLSILGISISWEQLQLERAGVSSCFDSEVLDAAKKLTQQPCPDYLDWTHHQTVTVDAESTQDYDDAISILDISDKAIMVAVHITLLADQIHPNSVLFEEAQKRVSSVYVPGKVHPMLPECLSHDHLSLKAGVERKAMSFIFQINLDGHASLQGIELTKIHVDHNLEYQEMDRWIESEQPGWSELSTACQAHEQHRIQKGAISFPKTSVKLHIDNPDAIWVEHVDRSTPAHRMVEELAVLVNTHAAKTLQKANIPAIYRTQAPYEEEGQKKQLSPTRLSTQARPHASLGCDVYIQASSPLRRFGDLIAQIQLLAWLQKRDSLSKTSLFEWMEQIESRTQALQLLTRNLENYWKEAYMQQNPEKSFSTEIRRHLNNGHVVVWIEELKYLRTQPPS